MVRDNLSNFIVALKNASHSGQASLLFPQSKLIVAVAEVLSRAGFIKAFSKKAKKRGKFVELELIEKVGGSTIKEVRRISVRSKRIYRKAGDLRSVRNGYGAAIISTSQGLLTDKEARQKKLGGEVLFEIW